ncbi:MAG: peptide ABC transporter substrate-binding protein [Tissierellia bacterium]|nr:peptide ABC transporter substrate-binding protein [Tissierellia bacterium]
MIWKKSLIIILIISLLMTSCGQVDIPNTSVDSSNEIEELTPVEGGEIIVPLTNLNTLNPLLTTNLYYYYFSKLIYEGLFDFDDNLNVIPKLAKDYTILNGGRTVSIELRDGIKWHDGEDFTAEDVAFTIDVIKYAKRESIYGSVIEENLGLGQAVNFNSVINTKIINNRAIEINFDKPYLNNLEILTFPIIPKHHFIAKGSNAIVKALEIDDYIPIGTGPYKFDSYEKNKTIKLSRNTDYWNGSPFIQQVIGKVLDDEKLILTAFETGQINMATTLGVDWDKYKQNSRIKVLEFISPNHEFLAFNYNNPLLSGELGLAIRKAIYYGINRQDIIHKVYLGHGTQIDIPLHPDSYLISDKAFSYGFNKEKAIEILEEAGFKDLDDDGILEGEDGKKLKLRLLTNPNNSYRRLVSDLIKEHLKDIGMKIILDFDTKYVKDYDGEEQEALWQEFITRLNRGDYDIVLMGWQSSIIPNLFPYFHSSMIDSGKNVIKFQDQELDQILTNTLINQSRDLKPDLYESLQEYMVENIPYVGLYFINKGLLVDTKIKGDLNPNFNNIYNGIENCFVKEKND